MTKKDIVTAVVNWTEGWNHEIHEVIQKKVLDEFEAQFPKGAEDSEAVIKKMNEFYYTRMSNTANILVAISAFVVSCVALIVSIVALKG
ncbi:hypothetical protein [Chromobacterium haemolyticum]|uniref:hypothetical protein n=1 Tax=Chromobacterium haemolyticum TaxID=394935 RepID=UPI000DEFE9F7|nr:hypothetical protein [Chromobacterium haemolyticum]